MNRELEIELFCYFWRGFCLHAKKLWTNFNQDSVPIILYIKSAINNKLISTLFLKHCPWNNIIPSIPFAKCRWNSDAFFGGFVENRVLVATYPDHNNNSRFNPPFWVVVLSAILIQLLAVKNSNNVTAIRSSEAYS